MNIRDAKQEIIHTVMAYTAKDRFGAYAIPQGRQRPLLLIGPPGIGKTAIMEQAAAECGVGFVSYTMTHHTRQSAIGLPFISQCQFDGHEYSVTEYTMSEIIASVYRCMKESGKKEGLLFLDEINCVSETLAPVMLQFLQNKTFGNQHLPEGWIVAAAGNPQEYNKSVREFDLATLDRLKYISVEADYEAWRPYALAAGIHGAILSYLDTHHDRFYVLQQTYAEKIFATARGWEDLSCILLRYEELKLPVTPDLIGQYLHCEELARDFSGYYHLYNSRQKAIPVIAMLNGNEPAADVCRKLLSGSSFDEKLMLLHLCLSALNGYLSEYEAEYSRLGEYQNALERLLRYQKQQSFPSLQQTIPSFIKKEEEILEIRREHGLSSEEEIRNMRAMLYELRELTYKYQAAHPDTFDSVSAIDICRDDSHMVDASASWRNDGGTASMYTSYENGTFPGDIREFLEHTGLTRKSALTSKAEQLLVMTDRCIALFLEADGPEFTLLLSALSENTVFTRFFRQHPSSLFASQKERLKFRSREDLLRQELTGM